MISIYIHTMNIYMCVCIFHLYEKVSTCLYIFFYLTNKSHFLILSVFWTGGCYLKTSTFISTCLLTNQKPRTRLSPAMSPRELAYCWLYALVQLTQPHVEMELTCNNSQQAVLREAHSHLCHRAFC